MFGTLRASLPRSSAIAFGAATVCALAALAPATPANAATFQLYNCTGKYLCSYTWTLGKLATKEFRGVCNSGKTPSPAINFSNKGKNTTCTIPWASGGGKYGIYETRSCTNWSVTKKDAITVKLTCSGG